MSETTEEITLSEDQENALHEFVGFLGDLGEQVFVLEGYSGTGKSTLVKTLMDRLSSYLKTIKLINPQFPDYDLKFTATTNKAADTFSQITGQEVITIHSLLGLRVNMNYKTKKTELVKTNAPIITGSLIFIDEASFADRNLLQLIFEQTSRCKIVFIGDRAQLTPVMSSTTPVFHAGFKGAMLTKPMRQMVNGVPQANPITDLATQFRETVSTGIWTPFKPDGQYVIHLNQSDFEDAIIEEFVRDDWKYKDSKVLGWTNACVIKYNEAINSLIKGTPEIEVGDFVTCNKMVYTGDKKLKTDQMVLVTAIEPDTEEYGCIGNYYTLDHTKRFFKPKTLQGQKAAYDRVRIKDDFHGMRTIADSWIDLRVIFAQTVNKAQGSTFDRVYIDLNDIGRCNQGDQIARMLYVGVSRARLQVFLTGDFG